MQENNFPLDDSLQNEQSDDKQINPVFDDINNPETITNHIQDITEKCDATPHNEILSKLLNQIVPIDFEALAFPHVVQLRKQLEGLTLESEEAKVILKKLEKLTLNNKHYLVLSIENIVKIAVTNRWGLCKNLEFVYFYNGAYWSYLEKEEFQKFLGEAAQKMGVPEFTAKHFQFREQLLKQFLATEYIPTTIPPKEAVYINLKNGTFEVTPNGNVLRPFNRSDFLTYQLKFKYDPKAKAPIFQNYLDKVLPDKERQFVLAEGLGYVFIKNGSNNLKEEKALVLYGSGANGKSVFYEIVNALLGNENVSSYSLQDLTDRNGYNRAMIANKLVNYASEINGKLETSIFKQLVSGEPVTARLPYTRPMQLTQYAKLIFNCNELPKEIEHTIAYFRRYLIIPFDVTIPEDEQDKQLHSKIIENELSGVFNWVLEGLNRLLSQKRFSHCEAAIRAVEQYKIESDSVKQFISDSDYQPSPTENILIKVLYIEYRMYCTDDGFIPVNKRNFNKRLQSFGVIVEKKNIGFVAYLSKGSLPF